MEDKQGYCTVHNCFYSSNPGFWVLGSPRERTIAEVHVGHCQGRNGMIECLDC